MTNVLDLSKYRQPALSPVYGWAKAVETITVANMSFFFAMQQTCLRAWGF